MKDIQKEITPIAEDDLFIVLNHPNAKFDYPVHYHPDYEINLVLNASGTRIVGDVEEEFGKVDLVMTGPNLPHAWKSDCKEGHHVITIQFHKEILDYPILQKRLFSSIKELLIKSRLGLSFPDVENTQIVDKIVKLTRLKGFQTALEFLSVLYTLSISNMQTLVSNQYDQNAIVSSVKSRRVMKVCDYIDTHFDEQIKLSDVASLVNMSESAFSHFFKKKTGFPFINYLNNVRISKASLMLADTTLSINEICYASGFNNSSNFIRIFKKIKGLTPSEYRTNIQQMLIKY
jgi:AraC-like DNA-binding protein